MANDEVKLTKSQINLLLFGMIISGACNTLIYKYQNTSIIDGQEFYHPFMQAFAMFVGEAGCIFIYLYLRN